MIQVRKKIKTNMKKSIKTNYLYNLSYQLMVIMLPLITTPYVSRILGAGGIGDYSYTSGIVSYFGLAAATGTLSFAQREIAVCQNEKTKRSVLFWEIFLFRALSGALVLAAYTFFVRNFMPQYKVLYRIQYLTVFSWLADISWYFQGTENYKITSVKNSVVKIIGTALIFIFVKKVEDLWIYALIASGTALAGNLSMWGYIFREVCWPGFRKIHIFRNVKDIMELFVPVLSIQLYTVLDKTMLGSLCNTVEVGYYSQAEKIVKLALTVVSAFISVLMPRLAVLYRSGDMKNIMKYYKRALDFIFLLALPMLAGCLLLSGEFVPFFFGKGYHPVIRLMRIESLLFIILSLGQMFGNFLIAMNRQKEYTAAVTMAAAVNVILNYLFIRYADLGATGAATASVIAESVSTGVQFYFAKDLLGYRPIFRSLAKYILPTGIMAVAILTVRYFFEGFLSLVLSVVLGMTTYGVFLLICRDEMAAYILHWLLNRRKRRGL